MGLNWIWEDKQIKSNDDGRGEYIVEKRYVIDIEGDCVFCLMYRQAVSGRTQDIGLFGSGQSAIDHAERLQKKMKSLPKKTMAECNELVLEEMNHV